MAQRGDEGLGIPVTERGVIYQPRALGEPSGGFGHVGLERGLINETDAWQQVSHERLASRDPDMARLANLRPFLLDSLQVFFCVSVRDHGASARPTRDGPSPGAHRQFPEPGHQA